MMPVSRLGLRLFLPSALSRLEDAHEIAVKGQAAKIGNQNIGDLIVDLRSILDEINIHIDAIDLIQDS